MRTLLLLALLALCALPQARAEADLSGQVVDADVFTDATGTNKEVRYTVAYGQLAIWTKESYKKDEDPWNSDLHQLPGDFRWLAHVTQIALRERKGCVLDGGEVLCYEVNAKPGDMFGVKIPRITGALQVEVGESHACALTQDALTCWGQGHPAEIHALVGGKAFGSARFGQQIWPKGVDQSTIGACAIDENGLHCWNVSEDVAKIPPLEHPTAVALDNGRACAIDGESIVCWGNGFPYTSGCYDKNHDGNRWCGSPTFNFYARPMIPSPRLAHPEQIQMTDYEVCALGDGRVKCWSTDQFGQLPVPPLRESKKLKVTNGRFCAVARNGVSCWSTSLAENYDAGGGRSGYREAPHYTLVKMPPDLVKPDVFDSYQVSPFSAGEGDFSSYLAKLARASSPARARFVNELKSYLDAELPLPPGYIGDWEKLQKDKVPNAYARYWLLMSLRPLITSGDTAVGREAIAPDYFDSVELAQSMRLRMEGVARLHFDPDMPEKTAANRKVLLKVIQAALTVGGDFLNGEDRGQTAGALRALGDAFMNPLDDGKMAAALGEVEILPAVTRLGANTKSAFLAQTVHAAAAWLQGRTQ